MSEDEKKLKKQKKHRLKRYFQAIPEILLYEVFITLGLVAILTGLEYLVKKAIYSTGRVALTTGDFTFLFTTWQGWCILLICVAVLFVYVALDINTKFYYAQNVMDNEKGSLFKNLAKGFASIRLFLNPGGIFTIVFLIVALPILGVGVSVGLTSNFYIPTFITSVIFANKYYTIAYFVVLFILFGIFIWNIFLLPNVLLNEMSVQEAGSSARRLMKQHFWNFVKETLFFIIKFFVIVMVIRAIVLYGPMYFIQYEVQDTDTRRFLLIFFAVFGGVIVTVSRTFSTPFYIIKLTELFYSYVEGKPVFVPVRKKKHHPFMWLATAVLIVISASVGFLGTLIFDETFSAEVKPQIIAHRLGGYEGPENTVEGLKTSIELGAAGAETDVQRTKDGQYIILHDDNFKRLCGIDKKPSELTLDEIKEFTITDREFTAKISTLEEVLDTANGEDILLFVELKGATADIQMADDVVQMVKDKGMQEQVIIISLKYNLIDHIESNYPEMKTSFLAFGTFGDTANLDTDGLALEEESATDSTIAMIHEADKWVQIWTPDEEKEQIEYLNSYADYIITDNVKQAQRITEKLENRNDMERVVSKIIPNLFYNLGISQ